MLDFRTLWLLVPEPVRRFPTDLSVVVALVALTCGVVLLPGHRWTPIQIVFGLQFVFFLPGYALVAVLFPEKGSQRTGGGESESSLWRAERRIDGFERVVLSFGLSLAIVPLVGLALNFTPFGIRPVPVLVSISGLTVALAVLAAVRRWDIPPDERFRVPYDQWYARVRSALLHADSSVDKALNIALVVSLLLAAGSVTYVVASPKPPETYTEFYLLAEGDDGELVADGYPTEYVHGESRHLIVGIGNHEQTSTNYTVVVELQRIATEDGTTRVIEERELNRFQVALADDETWQRRHAVTPTMTGDRFRLQYLLYRGEAPAEPRSENAYKEVHLWVNVSAS